MERLKLVGPAHLNIFCLVLLCLSMRMGFDHISHWSKLKITHKIVYISGGGLGMRNVTRLFGYISWRAHA